MFCSESEEGNSIVYVDVTQFNLEESISDSRWALQYIDLCRSDITLQMLHTCANIQFL